MPPGALTTTFPLREFLPTTMIRQVRGEALSIGDVLTWGPSWYYQKQFFTGHTESPAAGLEHAELQAANGVTLVPEANAERCGEPVAVRRGGIRLSVEPNGHMVLLRLKEQDYPGTKLIEDWPSWNLPILKWVRAQGGFGGYAHCGAGMVVEFRTAITKFAVRFHRHDGDRRRDARLCRPISGCDTPAVAELNRLVHMLNCGFVWRWSARPTIRASPASGPAEDAATFNSSSARWTMRDRRVGTQLDEGARVLGTGAAFPSIRGERTCDDDDVSRESGKRVDRRARGRALEPFRRRRQK